MPNRDHEDSYYDRSFVRTERNYDPTGDRGRGQDPRSYQPSRERDERAIRTQPGYAQTQSYESRRSGPRSRGWNQAEYERAQGAYAPEWRSYAQDWRDSPPPQLQHQPQPYSPRTWARAEGYAQQRTDSGHRHESVFGEQEHLREEWDRQLGRDSLHSRSDYQNRVQFAPQHDDETLGQQIRHASHVVVNRVKRAFRGPKGYKRSDERIREDVSDRFAQQDQIDPSELEVQVEAGEVTLTGTVHSRWDKFAAEEIADSVSGVEEVHNRLRVRRIDTMTATGELAIEPSQRNGGATQAESPLRNRNIRA